MDAKSELINPCPFCGGEFNFQLTDEEGNERGPDYLNNPYSGVEYRVTHEGKPDCPIRTHIKGEKYTQYISLYDSKADAALAFNMRKEGADGR